MISPKRGVYRLALKPQTSVHYASSKRRYALELTPTVLIAIAIAGGLGILIGWLIRPARVVMTTPPDLDRERTLAQAEQDALMERIQGHLQATEADLFAIQARQTALIAELKGESAATVTVGLEQPALVQDPRDYADTRGQLRHP